MGERSGIEWTDHTFNPWLGCERVSPGCQHCYAESWAKRSGLVEWGRTAERRVTSDAYWRQPLRWNATAEAAGRQTRVFCASLADVFEDRTELVEPRDRLFSLIDATPHLIWMLLTKRPQHVASMVTDGWLPSIDAFWPENLWIGTTIEDQQRADERLPHLRAIPARVRFLSCEPLLGPLALDLSGIDWVIVGGESGPGARPMHPDWVRDIQEACGAHQTRFFFKQWGEWVPYEPEAAEPFWQSQHGDVIDAHHFPDFNLDPPGWHAHPPDLHTGAAVSRRVGKKTAGRLLDGVAWDEVPEGAVR